MVHLSFELKPKKQSIRRTSVYFFEKPAVLLDHGFFRNMQNWAYSSTDSQKFLLQENFDPKFFDTTLQPATSWKM